MSTSETTLPQLTEYSIDGAGAVAASFGKNQALRQALAVALARERELLRERDALQRQQQLLAEEFEHRLANSLQLVAGLLSMQSRTASTAEASDHLIVASNRVSAIGRIHRRLHLLGHNVDVEFKEFLRGLCDDLDSLLFSQASGRRIVVSGVEIRLPTALAVPLGLIVNELVTNSAKYGNGTITVELETAANAHVFSVADEGPGLPRGFDPSHSKGLGMRIIESLLKRMGGRLRLPEVSGSPRARFSVELAVIPNVSLLPFDHPRVTRKHDAG